MWWWQFFDTTSCILAHLLIHMATISCGYYHVSTRFLRLALVAPPKMRKNKWVVAKNARLVALPNASDFDRSSARLYELPPRRPIVTHRFDSPDSLISITIHQNSCRVYQDWIQCGTPTDTPADTPSDTPYPYYYWYLSKYRYKDTHIYPPAQKAPWWGYEK